MVVKRREPDKNRKKEPKRSSEPVMRDWPALVLRSRESPSLAPRASRPASTRRKQTPAGD